MSYIIIVFKQYGRMGIYLITFMLSIEISRVSCLMALKALILLLSLPDMALPSPASSRKGQQITISALE